ncbi:MAG: hypothetical protein Q7J15_03200 [Candidatus Desulfaltia sp.]|nr:hypothetical protein [Candidatus Desulfaltia sp.]
MKITNLPTTHPDAKFATAPGAVTKTAINMYIIKQIKGINAR